MPERNGGPSTRRERVGEGVHRGGSSSQLDHLGAVRPRHLKSAFEETRYQPRPKRKKKQFCSNGGEKGFEHGKPLGFFAGSESVWRG